MTDKELHPTEQQKSLVELEQVLTKISNTQDVCRFLLDILTPKELQALKERWRVCQLLHQDKLSYREIHKLTGASLTTIGRVSRFLKIESNGGYRNILKSLNKEIKK